MCLSPRVWMLGLIIDGLMPGQTNAEGRNKGGLENPKAYAVQRPTAAPNSSQQRARGAGGGYKIGSTRTIPRVLDLKARR